jgi:PTS system mannose-specific IIB component
VTLVLSRVDDRLVHGQVVEGWLRVVQAERVVVVCDQAAQDALQKGMMRLALPEEVALDVMPLETALRELSRFVVNKERVLLLLPGVKELRVLVEGGVALQDVNLGGVHDGPGRRSVAPNLFLSEADRKDLAVVLARKVIIETRALPSDPIVPLDDWWSAPSTSPEGA